MKQTQKTVLFLLVSILICWYVFRLDQYITPTSVMLHKNFLQRMVHDHYLISAIVYMVLYAALTACALPVAGILTLSGGFLFGALLTTIYVSVAATIGAVVSFLLARYIFRDLFEHYYPHQLRWLNNELAHYGYSYMLVVRLIPFVPFFIINPLAGLTALSVATFIWTTAIGIVPSTFVFALAGQQLAQITSVRDILSAQTIVVLLLFALLALVPMMVIRLRKSA